MILWQRFVAIFFLFNIQQVAIVYDVFAKAKNLFSILLNLDYHSSLRIVVQVEAISADFSILVLALL